MQTRFKDVQPNLDEMTHKQTRHLPTHTHTHLAHHNGGNHTAAEHGAGGAEAGAQEVDYHFVCLVQRNGTLYELDGLKRMPIVHGPTTPDTFLMDAAAALRRKYTDKDPDGRFALMAITAAAE